MQGEHQTHEKQFKQLIAMKDALRHDEEERKRQAIEKDLEATRWNKTAAAKRLGISFRALRYRLKKLGME